MSPAREPVTVMMTGAGAPGASGVLRSLRASEQYDVRVVGVDARAGAYGFDLVDAHATVPHGDDPTYVDRVAELVVTEDVDVVLPLTTAELQPLAAGRAAIDATVAVSPAEPLAVANDKGALYAHLAEAGHAAAPAFHRVDDEAAFTDAVERLGYPDRPVCVKRPVASGMRGFRVLDPGADRLEQFLTEKPTTATTTLEELRPVLASAEAFPELVVMEYLPGPEYSVDVLAMGDAVGPVVPRSRSRTRAGISFAGTVERRADIVEATTGICTDLGLEYTVNLQFRDDADGEPRLIEINPRIPGTVVFSVAAGANLPALSVAYARGDALPPTDVAWGTEMVRYWQELFRTPEGESFHLTGAVEGRPLTSITGDGERP